MAAKDKATLMRESRQRRREGGLVEYRAWLTPAQKKKVEAFVKSLQPKSRSD